MKVAANFASIRKLQYDDGNASAAVAGGAADGRRWGRQESRAAYTAVTALHLWQ